jgi:hypothetical protein
MNLDTLAYISEQTSYPSDYKTPFGYTVHDRNSRFYLTFEAVLQSFGVMNRNRRMYEAANVMERINNDEYIQTMLKQNAWFGEIDHPAPQYAGQELAVNRIANPLAERSSHYIRRPRLNGNLLEASIQTDSSNEHGMNMAIKIVDGKIIPCFSARVLGELQNKNGQPVVNVRRLVTFDWVIFPSHVEATGKITQPMTESAGVIENETGVKILYFKELAKMAANNSKETELLCESFGLPIDAVTGVTSTGNSVVVQEQKNAFVIPLTDKMIRAKTNKILRDWLLSKE